MGEKVKKGEGSYEGTEKYDKATRKFVETHDVDRLAKQAKRDLERDDGSLARAEQEGKGRAKEEDPELRHERGRPQQRH